MTTTHEHTALTTDQRRIRELEAMAHRNRDAYLASLPKNSAARGGLWVLHGHLPDDLREEYEMLTNWGGTRDRAEAKAAEEAKQNAEQNADPLEQMMFCR